ncbi:MAG: RtcB family protein [Leptospiraceae bacterium]|jgi:tRNA-splicing ligase RtcB|nr:RtcB family protein [Leptospiraceae bacterium]
MAISELQGKTVPVKLWTKLEDVESEALTQLKNIASLSWVFHHVAVMPDVHFGIGATVGSVIAMKDAISPAAVGVDIGCGMGAIRTNLKADALPDSLTEIRNKIEQKIPVGFNEHKQPKVQSRTNSLFAEFRSLHPKVMNLESKAVYQCGTLGGGNHFIELCLDTENTVWMMLHSGSRNIGKTLAEIHISTAKKLSHNTYLPDRDLAVFLAKTPEMEAYRRDLFWAQRYALLNRQTMFEIYKTILKRFFPEIKFEEPILCHHNYVSEETHFGEDVIVTRKGAISAREGEWGIIPGSMGTKSYIVRGLGNPESFHSASHGAGRRMSRTQAKKNYTLQDLESQTSGVECRKDGGVLDEIPGAYKNIDEVINNQKDLVKVEYELKQILCVKG